MNLLDHQLTLMNSCNYEFPLHQVFGRFLMVFVVLAPAMEIHDHPIVFVLFLVWSLIEVIRWVWS